MTDPDSSISKLDASKDTEETDAPVIEHNDPYLRTTDDYPSEWTEENKE